MKRKKKRMRRVWDVAFATYIATHSGEPMGFVIPSATKVADCAMRNAELLLVVGRGSPS